MSADDHNHDHDENAHSHSALGDRSAKRKPLLIALGITTVFLIVEVIGGIAAHSLALLADAGHMVTDAGALALSLFAAWLAGRPATARRSFGFMRAEILAAAVNAAVLLLLSLYIFYEAWERFSDPPEVRSRLMLGVAVAGLGANLVSAWVLSRGGGHKHDLNTRGAFLHVIGDLLGSVATIAAAVIILLTGWNEADPILSVVIGGLIVFSAWKLLKEAVDILLEATPAGIEPDEVRAVLRGVPGVAQVHDLHIWTVTSGIIAASAHLEITNVRKWNDILAEATHQLNENFGIVHATLQPEEYHPDRTGDRGCSLDTDEGLEICVATKN
ncbi:MAG TPA: cation diffusion facilitator family transporter [Thermomicrobiales bacterium]|nr:cation diffusion facilitator family transporter [Thermomicrobiales bacterium]